MTCPSFAWEAIWWLGPILSTPFFSTLSLIFLTCVIYPRQRLWEVTHDHHLERLYAVRCFMKMLCPRLGEVDVFFSLFFFCFWVFLFPLVPQFFIFLILLHSFHSHILLFPPVFGFCLPHSSAMVCNVQGLKGGYHLQGERCGIYYMGAGGP